MSRAINSYKVRLSTPQFDTMCLVGGMIDWLILFLIMTNMSERSSIGIERAGKSFRELANDEHYGKKEQKTRGAVEDFLDSNKYWKGIVKSFSSEFRGGAVNFESFASKELGWPGKPGMSVRFLAEDGTRLVDTSVPEGKN